MKKVLLVLLVFAGVFACGAVVGGALTFRFRDSFVEGRGAGKFVVEQWRDLTEKLDLTAEQKKKARPLIRRFADDQMAARKQGQIITERLRADLEALLTPEQLKTYRAFRAQQAQRDREHRIKERESRGGEAGPGHGGPMKPARERRLENSERPEPRDERKPEPPNERAPADSAPSSTPPASSTPSAPASP